MVDFPLGIDIFRFDPLVMETLLERTFLGILTLGITEMSIDKKNLSHECVIVWYKCTHCNHQFAVQYEIMNASDGKVMNYGYYKYRQEIQQSNYVNLSFDFVQQCYDKMWQNYRTGGHNCYHWAKDFSCKLRMNNSDAYYYGTHG